MRKPSFAVVLLCAAAAWGQTNTQSTLPDYLGPGVLSRGAANVGQRAGQDVDLRIYGRMSGIYDTGFNPAATNGTGGIASQGGLYGVEVGLGAYGKHTFKHGVLGLDYEGSYRHYTQNQYFNGANQQGTLGYTWQKSRRIIFDFRQNAGTSSYANSLVAGLPPANDAPVDSTTMLFDNRTTFLRSNVDMTYLVSQRTSITVGGDWNAVFRQSDALVGVRGYNIRGSIDHRFSQRTSGGLSYTRTHYHFPGTFGGSDLDMLSGTWARQFGRAWTLSAAAGVYRAMVEGSNRVNLEPSIALILGVSSVSVPFYRENVVPYGRASLTRRFQAAAWNLNYERSIIPGNGVYLTSKTESVSSAFSYSGVRRWTFSMNGGYGTLNSLGATMVPYSNVYGGADVSFTLTDSVHISAGFMARHQDVTISNFRQDSTRSTLSLVFSPGNIPISFR